MLKEKKALSKAYPIISSIWLYYRIVSVPKMFGATSFTLKNSCQPLCFDPVGFDYIYTLYESAEIPLRLRTAVE